MQQLLVRVPSLFDSGGARSALVLDARNALGAHTGIARTELRPEEGLIAVDYDPELVGRDGIVACLTGAGYPVESTAPGGVAEE